MKAFLARALPPLLSAVVFVALWHTWTQAFEIPAYLVPGPSEVLHEAWENRAELLPASLVTLAGAVAGFLLSLAVGLAMALVFAQARWIRASLYPYAIFLQTVPIVAVAPLIVLWCGAGFASIVLVSFVL